MKKASSKAASNKVRELEPFDKRSIDLTKFKPDLSATDLKKLLGPAGGIVIFPFLPIETLRVDATITIHSQSLLYQCDCVLTSHFA